MNGFEQKRVEREEENITNEEKVSLVLGTDIVYKQFDVNQTSSSSLHIFPFHHILVHNLEVSLPIQSRITVIVY